MNHVRHLRPTARPAVLHAAVLAALAACSDSSAPSQPDPNLYRIVRKDLQITVKENAEMQALRETIVRSEVEGQSTVIFIIPEGSYVQKGDKLVELDVSELVEKRGTQGISVGKAEAALAQARKEKEILQKELVAKENTARSAVRIAEMELDKLLGRRSEPTGSDEGKNAEMVRKLTELVSTAPDAPPTAVPTDAAAKVSAPATATLGVKQVDPRTYQGLVAKLHELLAVDGDSTGGMQRDMGDLANKVLQQVDQIRLAMADLKVKEDTFGYSEKLASKSFITRNELEKDRLAWQSQLSKVTLAWNDLDLLINYELAKERIKLEDERANARLELERVLASNDAAVTKADSELQSKDLEFKLAKERLENLDRQIQSAVMYAPTPGLVVYARIDRDRRGGEAVREGVQVRERQELIVLPDTTKMRCVLKVQEAQVAMVKVGQPAYVQVEARVGETFTGRVTNVAPTADSNSGWMSSDRKVYTTVVELDSDNPDATLRSRMAAAVTVVVDTVKDTLAVPLQAVRRDRSVNYVWKQTAEGPRAVPIDVGRHNAEQVEIQKGLTEGDTVYLTPPLGVDEPKFEQPALPTPAPLASPPSGTPTPQAQGTGDGNDRSGDAQAGPGGGRQRGAGGMGPTKKFAEMTPEELTQYREQRLAMWQGMIDRLRDSDPDRATSIEANVTALRAALEANKLDEAQTLADKMRSLMPRRNNGAGNGPGGGGNGPGGNGPGGNGPGSNGDRGDRGNRGNRGGN